MPTKEKLAADIAQLKKELSPLRDLVELSIGEEQEEYAADLDRKTRKLSALERLLAAQASAAAAGGPADGHDGRRHVAAERTHSRDRDRSRERSRERGSSKRPRVHRSRSRSRSRRDQDVPDERRRHKSSRYDKNSDRYGRRRSRSRGPSRRRSCSRSRSRDRHHSRRRDSRGRDDPRDRRKGPGADRSRSRGNLRRQGSRSRSRSRSVVEDVDWVQRHDSRSAGLADREQRAWPEASPAGERLAVDTPSQPGLQDTRPAAALGRSPPTSKQTAGEPRMQPRQPAVWRPPQGLAGSGKAHADPAAQLAAELAELPSGSLSSGPSSSNSSGGGSGGGGSIYEDGAPEGAAAGAATAQAAVHAAERKFLRPPVPSGPVGIKLNLKRNADRLYVDADSTWLLWQGRRRPNTCTMVAYNGQEYMATDVTFRDSRTRRNTVCLPAPFPGMEAASGWGTVRTFLGLQDFSLIGMYLEEHEDQPDWIMVVKIADGPSDWRPVKVPDAAKAPHPAAVGGRPLGGSTSKAKSAGVTGAAAGSQMRGGSAVGGILAAGAGGFDAEAGVSTVEYRLPPSLNQLCTPAALVQQLPQGMQVPADISMIMDQLPNEPPVPVTSSRERGNSIKIQAGWAQIRSALDLHPGHRVRLQLQPATGCLHIWKLGIGGHTPAKALPAAAKPRMAAAVGRSAPAAAAGNPQLAGRIAGAALRALAADLVAQAQRAAASNDATQVVAEVEYTLPGYMAILTVPSALVQHLPPDAEAALVIPFVMQLPDVQPVAVHCSRKGNNRLVAQGGWAEVRRVLNLTSGDRIRMQLRLGPTSIHICKLSSGERGNAAAPAPPPAAPAAAAHPSPAPTRPSAAPAAARQHSAVQAPPQLGDTLQAAAVVSTVEYTVPQTTDQLYVPAALVRQLPPGTTVPAALSIIMDQMPHEPPVPVTYKWASPNQMQVMGGWSVVKRALGLCPGDRLRLQLRPSAARMHVTKLSSAPAASPAALAADPASAAAGGLGARDSYSPRPSAAARPTSAQAWPADAGGIGGADAEVTYTLPNCTVDLKCPWALLQQLPPAAELPQQLCFIVDQLPQEAPVPLNYSRQQARFVIMRGWAKVKRLLDLRPGDRIRLQLRLESASLHISKLGFSEHCTAQPASAAVQSPAPASLPPLPSVLPEAPPATGRSGAADAGQQEELGSPISPAAAQQRQQQEAASTWLPLREDSLALTDERLAMPACDHVAAAAPTVAADAVPLPRVSPDPPAPGVGSGSAHSPAVSDGATTMDIGELAPSHGS